MYNLSRSTWYYFCLTKLLRVRSFYQWTAWLWRHKLSLTTSHIANRYEEGGATWKFCHRCMKSDQSQRSFFNEINSLLIILLYKTSTTEDNSSFKTHLLYKIFQFENNQILHNTRQKVNDKSQKWKYIKQNKTRNSVIFNIIQTLG